MVRKNIDLVQILAIPRGALIDKSGLVTINGTVVSELKPVTPFEPTPALELADQREVPAPPAPIELPERLPVIELETDNVTRLVRARRRSDDDPAGAA